MSFVSRCRAGFFPMKFSSGLLGLRLNRFLRLSSPISAFQDLYWPDVSS
jgi:hypothetical protein